MNNAQESRATKPAITANAIKNQAGSKPPANVSGRPNARRQQLRCLAAIDEGAGALLKALEETHPLENTMVVFSSDNGFFWDEHDLGDKRWAYEESIRDPFELKNLVREASAQAMLKDLKTEFEKLRQHSKRDERMVTD